MQNGNICLDNSNFCFSQSLSEKAFLLSIPGKDANLLIDNAGYRTYQLKPHAIKGTLFSYLVIFFNGRIQSVALTICEDTGPNNYVESELVSLKQKHDIWLLSVFGHKGPYSFSWGTVESFYDKKSWSSSILFRYL